MTIVDLLKYCRVSKSNATVNWWWPHTTQPIKVILTIQKIIVVLANTSSFPETNATQHLTTAKLGKIKTYTSGCPKNQNMCWNKTTSALFIS